jgi:hypothetical protein
MRRTSWSPNEKRSPLHIAPSKKTLWILDCVQFWRILSPLPKNEIVWRYLGPIKIIKKIFVNLCICSDLNAYAELMHQELMDTLPSQDWLRALSASCQAVWARSQESLSSLLRPSSHSQLVASFIRTTVYACSCSGYSQLVAYHLCMRSLQHPASQFWARYQPNLSSLQRTASHLNF